MNDNLVDLENKSKFGKLEILLICCIVFQLVICLMPFHYGDGLNRDELYQIAMSSNPGWGYVDVPPLPPFMLYIIRALFGTSIFSVHLLPAISGAFIIFLTYKMTKIFEGGFFVLALAIIPVTFISSVYGSVYVYDTFDILFWNIIIFCLLKLLKTDNKNWWIYFGIASGFALLTKLTVLFLGVGIVFSLLFTKERKNFKELKFWIAGVIAFLIFSPYIIWNIYNGFPTLEFFANYASDKLIPLSLIDYLLVQIVSPYTIPAIIISVLGLYFFIFANRGRYRILGLTYIVIFVLVVFKNARPNLIWPYYPILLVGGGVLIDELLNKKVFLIFKAIILILVFGTCVFGLPNYRSILPLQTYLNYNYKVDVFSISGSKRGILPAIYADSFGWKDLTEKVAKVYNSLPIKQRSKTAIYTWNYGEAGAISLFGVNYGLPKPISGHNQYYLWGPRNHTGESVILVGWYSEEELELLFKSVKLMDKTNNDYCKPYENNLPIWLCKKPKFKSLNEIWPDVKHYN